MANICHLLLMMLLLFMLFIATLLLPYHILARLLRIRSILLLPITIQVTSTLNYCVLLLALELNLHLFQYLNLLNLQPMHQRVLCVRHALRHGCQRIFLYMLFLNKLLHMSKDGAQIGYLLIMWLRRLLVKTVLCKLELGLTSHQIIKVFRLGVILLLDGLTITRGLL